MDVTFFYGNERIMTSVKDSEGNRILGSPAGDIIVEKVLNGGEEYFSSSVSLDGTMNYGYVGTRELNEALVSRFMVIDMPSVTYETLMLILKKIYPDAKVDSLDQFAGLFLDLQLKATNGEITTKPLDLRGMIASIGTIRTGLKPSLAIRMGIINKSFDTFEREIVEDVVMTRIPEDMKPGDVF